MEETPICCRCKRLNLKCERGLKLMYQEDAVQRGISFGREGEAMDLIQNIIAESN